MSMGREKSEFHNKKAFQKTSTQCQTKSKSSKKPNQSRKESQQMDSLMFLKDPTDKKEVNGLDERIQLLKSELKMLLGDSKLDNTHHDCAKDSAKSLISQDLLTDENNLKRPLLLKPEIKPIKNVGPSKKPVPSQFSEWLDKTIDKMSTKSHQNQDELQCNDFSSNVCSAMSLTPEKSSTAQALLKCEFINSSSLSQDKVEELLYESFYLQNFEIHLSSPDKNTDSDKLEKALKLQKQKTRKSFKSNKKKFCQPNLKRHCRSQTGRKKKETVTNGCPKNNVPQSTSYDIQALKKKNLDYVNLDATNYDWSEPFEIVDKSESLSDVEILDFVEKTDIVKETPNNSEPLRSNLNANDEKQNTVQSYSGWECPICFEQSRGQEVVATQCGHVFCKRCLESHMSKFIKNCPTCRSDLTNKPTITLFNF